MSKPSKAMNSELSVTGKAVMIYRLDDLLTEAVEVELVAGQVVSVTNISKAPNLPANTIGACDKALWQQVRNQRRDS